MFEGFDHTDLNSLYDELTSKLGTSIYKKTGKSAKCFRKGERKIQEHTNIKRKGSDNQRNAYNVQM